MLVPLMGRIPGFVKTGWDIQKLLGGIHIQTQRQQSDTMILLLLSKNAKN
jgi:hypothetical protein